MHPFIRVAYVKIYQMTGGFVCLLSERKRVCVRICSRMAFEAIALVVRLRSSLVTNLTSSDQRHKFFGVNVHEPCQGEYPHVGRKANRNVKEQLTLPSSHYELF